jgi:hypothetical protein
MRMQVADPETIIGHLAGRHDVDHVTWNANTNS